jgi:hypothetical protein
MALRLACSMRGYRLKMRKRNARREVPGRRVRGGRPETCLRKCRPRVSVWMAENACRPAKGQSSRSKSA